MENTTKFVKTSTDDLTYKVIGCGMAVHRKLGPGLREDTYQRDLEIELTSKGISFQSQLLLEVRDHERGDALLGYYIPDLIVDQLVVVELKAVSAIDNAHLAQVIGYLAVTGLKVGLILNFGTKSLERRRVFAPVIRTDHPVNHKFLFVPDWMKKDRQQD